MILQTSIAFSLTSTQIIGAIGSAITVLFGGAVSLWKMFDRVSEVENKIKQEQRVNAKYFELFESQLSSINIQSMESRDLIIKVAAKIEVANDFDREFWQQKAEAERRAHKERLDQVMTIKTTQ